MTCFFTTIISTFESGLLYCILTNYNEKLSKLFVLNNYKKINTEFIDFSPVKGYNSNKNMEYNKLLSLINNMDIIFRVGVMIIFMITIVFLFTSH